MAKKGWIKHNQDVFKKAIAEHSNALEKRMANVFHELAEGVKAYVESLRDMPVDTGNLADGTGVGVYFNGMLKEYAPTPIADHPQTYEGDLVWGKDYLQDALTYASMEEFSSGIWVVLFSAIPYAVRVDKEGTFTKGKNGEPKVSTEPGFFSELLVPDMLNQFKLAFAREFPNIKLTV